VQFYVGAGRKSPLNLGLALKCDMKVETLFHKLKTSAYRCKKEHSVAFKICQNAFPALLGELTMLIHTPYLAAERTPLPYLTQLGARFFHLLCSPLGARYSAPQFGGGTLPPNIFL